MAFSQRNFGQIPITSILSIGAKTALSPDPGGTLILSSFSDASSTFIGMMTFPIIGTIVGVILSFLFSSLNKSRAKHAAKMEAFAAMYKAYVENATRILKLIGYEWNETDITTSDLYEFQLAMNTQDNTTVAAWMTSKGLNPARLIKDWPEIDPNIASNPERFLSITQVLQTVGYHQDMIDRIDYADENIFPFSDFYELIHKLKPTGDETNYAIYRFIVYLEEMWLDPYLLFPSLKNLPSIYVEGDYYMVVEKPSAITGQSEVTMIPVNEPEQLEAVVKSKIEVQQAGISSPLIWIPLVGGVISSLMGHRGR